MRNLKKVLAVILAVAILASMSVTALAAAPANQENAEKLQKIGLFLGNGAGGFDLEMNLSRLQAMIFVIRVKGEDAKAKALTEAEVAEQMANLTDASKIPSWAKQYAAYALKTGITLGSIRGGKKYFDGDAATSGKAFATFILRGMNYSPNYLSPLNEAFTAGIFNSVYAVYESASINRDSAVAILFAAVKEGKNSDGKKLIDVLIASKAVDQKIASEAGFCEAPKPIALSVESVTATNAIEVIVKFNMAVNETEAKKVSNYSVKKADDTDLVVKEASVSDDKMTVTLILTNAMVNYSTDNKITVKKALGLEADYSGKVGVSDDVIPMLSKVEATGPREITLTFSEPVKGAANTAFKLDKGTVALGTITAAGTKLTLNTLSNLSEGSHELELLANSAIKDNVDLVVKPGKYAFNFAKDSTPPTVTVKESSEYSVTLKFSKNVSNVDISSTLFSHTYDGRNQVAGDGAGTAVTGSNDEYVVTFNNPFAPGITNFYIGYGSGTTDANKIKDNFGNILAPVTLQITTSVDSTAPVAEKVEFKTATTAEVTFSEKVETASAQDKANYELKDSANKAVVISSVVLDSTGKVATVTFTEINGGAYTLTVKNVKDLSIAKNKMADTVLTFTASDKVNPKVSDADNAVGGTQAQKVAAKKIIVKFSEAMDVATITNKANYQLNGSPLASADTITAVDGNKGALITFEAAPAGTIRVGRVADVAGNTIAAFYEDVLIPGTVSDPLFDKAEVLSKNTVKLYFKEVITGAVANDFEIDPGDNTFDPVVGIATTVADGKTEITLTIDQDIAAANAQAGNVEVRAVGTVDATNDYGAAVVLAATPAADKMAPSVIADGYSTLDVDKDGRIDHIKVVFDETMFAGSISMDKFTVAGYTVADAYASSTAPTATSRSTATVEDATTVYVRVTEKDDPDSDATPKVSILAGVKDAKGNAFEAVTDKATVDKAAPVMISAKATSATTLEITYSENVATTNLGFGDWVYDADAGGIGASVAATGVVATDGTGKTIVLTLPAGTFTTGTAVAAATITYTQNANNINDGVTATAGNAAVTPQTITGVTSGF